MAHNQNTSRHPSLVELDRMYAELVAQAEKLRDSFFEAALALTARQGKKGHVPICISVKSASPNSCSFLWMTIALKAGEGGKKREQDFTTIDKGPGNKYSVSQFKFVKGPLNGLVRNYECKLAEIREACSVIMTIRRSLSAAVKRAEKAHESIDAFIIENYPKGDAS